MTQHTPGPWNWHGTEMVYGMNGDAVADTANPAFPRDVEAANARLIAAAPEMLTLLERVWNQFGENGSLVMHDVRALLARIEGKE